MSPDVVLFAIRIISAVLLMLFMAIIAWLIYQDIRATRALLEDRRRAHGSIRAARLDEDGSGEQLVFPLSPVTSIGRANSNTVVLEDDFVSGEHALLMLRGQQWWLEDLNSRNGTLLNGARLTEATVVSPGDVIVIGNVQLKVEPTN
ncbi:MAG TPA: FHA domain-containing protein [Candidatus Binatia bacterium]|jgi:pSer/pThr/pTyr-binding forkhead associated (FHA) protein|nr:FHA domain-containing protein [Candidatus Binatia bacterium]